MSDWGATASWDFALKRLDQGSGVQRDMKLWRQDSFTAPLRKAYAEGKGKLPKERLSDMVRRILRSMYAIGIDKWGAAAGAHGGYGEPQRDRAEDRAAGHRVLLKNEGRRTTTTPFIRQSR